MDKSERNKRYYQKNKDEEGKPKPTHVGNGISSYGCSRANAHLMFRQRTARKIVCLFELPQEQIYKVQLIDIDATREAWWEFSMLSAADKFIKNTYRRKFEILIK